MKCPSCNYMSFKIVPKCSDCGFDFKKLNKEPAVSRVRKGFTVFAGTPEIAVAEAETAVATVMEESPGVGSASEISEEAPRDFELNLSDAQETPVQAEAAPPAQPVADLMDESVLPNDFGEAADLDVSDIEVEGLGFEGMDFGETTEAAVELAKPDSAPPADKDISLDLGGEPAEPEVSLDEATEPVPVAEELALNAEEPSTSVEPEVSLDLGDEDSGLEVTDAAEINLEPETEGLGLGEETTAPAVEEEPPASEVEAQEIVFELEGDDEAPATTPKEPDTAIPEIEDLGLEIELSDDPAPPEEDTK